jgi:hypothetical protein
MRGLAPAHPRAYWSAEACAASPPHTRARTRGRAGGEGGVRSRWLAAVGLQAHAHPSRARARAYAREAGG